MALPNLVIDGVYIPKESISRIETKATQYDNIRKEVKDVVRVHLKNIVGGFIDGAGDFRPSSFDLYGEDAEKLKELLEGINTFQHLSLSKDHWHKFNNPVNSIEIENEEENETVQCPNCKATLAINKKDMYFPIIQCCFCEREFTYYQIEKDLS